MSDDPYKAPSSEQDRRPLRSLLTPVTIAVLILLCAFVVTWWISGTVFWGIAAFLMFGTARLVGWLVERSAGASATEALKEEQDQYRLAAAGYAFTVQRCEFERSRGKQ